MEPVCSFMSSSNCYFLTCIQVSQKAGQVVWYSHLLKSFPQFVVIHTVKGFGIVNNAEDVFLELSCFFDDPTGVGNLNSSSSAFSKTSLNIWMFTVDLEKAEEPEIKLPTSVGSSKKQESSRKTSSTSLVMLKPLIVWITINCGKIL